MSRKSTKYILPVLALLITLAAAGPVYAWSCDNPIAFTSTSSSSSPIVLTTIPQSFGPSGNTISYSGFTSDYMYVYITGVTSGWTVTITTASASTTVTSPYPGIIVGPYTGSGSFSYTIKVTAPATPSTPGQFTINAIPDNSGTTGYTSGSHVGNPCTALTVYLKTGSVPPFTPPSPVPQFPLGMAVLMGAAFPALLLARRKFAGTPTL